MKPEEIVQSVEKIVSPVYLVGGSVRDMIIGCTPKDYDFCTPLAPDEIEAKIKEAGRKAHDSGKRFGTVGFVLPQPPLKGLPIEITTFRHERYTSGSRKPEVEFVSDLKEDLSRRDFTFNAIAFKEGEYYDPFGGRLDILAKKIKAVGDATHRFREDPLRMLRAARFASQLGFEIDPNMVGKIRKMPETILNISRERWTQELDKLLIGEHPERGLNILVDTYLLKYMIPELYLLSQDNRLWDITLNKLLESPRDADTRWGVLLMDIAKPYVKQLRKNSIAGLEIYNYPDSNLIGVDIVDGLSSKNRLKFSNERTEKIKDITLKERYEKGQENVSNN